MEFASDLPESQRHRRRVWGCGERKEIDCTEWSGGQGLGEEGRA